MNSHLKHALICLIGTLFCIGNSVAELLAFPTAEGYGRHAKGGRGGRVIEVTNLNDSGPGSLRDAVEATGPRTVVFRVSGLITLKSKIVPRTANSFLTVAGQTAPGKGICIRNWTFGMFTGHDVIIRFVRLRLGDLAGKTMDGMGMAAADNSIFDHCSISWTIDEAFSSRSAKNVTLQRTLISEALNEANHEKYGKGAQHGFAASILGEIGSYHHNLLAHCAGRNWSMAGSLDKQGNTTGSLDIRNNVVYNWKHRTTDGEIRRVNFVNNYYKPGPASLLKVALKCTFTWEGKQLYYLSGNVMEGVFGPDEVSKSYATEGKKKPPEDYDYIVSEPLFPSYVVTQTAEEAYEDVLANVGCNKPALDEHDLRVIEETRNGTAKYKGSRTGLPGIPDTQEDVGGWDDYPMVKRPDNWDTDSDGMPDEWEKKKGLNPNNQSDGNGTDLSPEGYTNLEMYINELAGDFDNKTAISDKSQKIQSRLPAPYYDFTRKSLRVPTSARQPVYVSIMTAEGGLTHSETHHPEGSDELEISVDGLKPGVYLIKMEIGKSDKTWRLNPKYHKMAIF